MLRALVLALLAANLGFFAWTEGWLDRVVGIRAGGEREPERLLRQVRPESIRVIPPGAPMPASAPASSAATPTACLESAPMSAAQVSAADAALRRLQPPLPERSWSDENFEQPVSWLVYMGRYAGPEALAKKEDELRRRHLDFEVVQTPAPLAPGIALGRFGDRPAADEALVGFARQGIHTARVVRAVAPEATRVLRFAVLDSSAAARVAALRGEVYGDGFKPCVPTPAGIASAVDAASAVGLTTPAVAPSGASAASR